jgi:hypothetical protein
MQQQSGKSSQQGEGGTQTVCLHLHYSCPNETTDVCVRFRYSLFILQRASTVLFCSTQIKDKKKKILKKQFE